MGRKVAGFIALVAATLVLGLGGHAVASDSLQADNQGPMTGSTVQADNQGPMTGTTVQADNQGPMVVFAG